MVWASYYLFGLGSDQFAKWEIRGDVPALCICGRRIKVMAQDVTGAPARLDCPRHSWKLWRGRKK